MAGDAPAVDADGHSWQPDASVAVGGRIYRTPHAVTGTTSPVLFETERWGMTGYRIPVPQAGSYLVQLNEAEIWWTDPGIRVFSVTAENQPVLSRYDILAHAGGALTAVSPSFVVPVTDGELDMDFTNQLDYGKLDSISVTLLSKPAVSAPTPSAASAPATVTVTATTTVTATVTAIVTAPASAPPAGAAPPALPGPSVSPVAYGAVGDGMHDDTAALQAALDAGSAQTPVVLPAGMTFAHSAVLHVQVPGESVVGTGTLLATNEQASSVWVEANDVTLDGPTLATAHTTQRWSAWEQMGLRVENFTGDVVRNVTVRGSAAAGIYVGGAQHFTLDHDTVVDTRADGIHMTAGAAFGTVASPMTTNTGDDGVAVVSYSQDGPPCHDITVTGAHVRGTTGGRGISVVGGTNITESGFEVDRSAAAGVYVAAEGNPYYTAAPTNVSILDGLIRGANTDPTIDHGSVLVLSGETSVWPVGVTLRNMTISESRPTATRDVGVISYGAAPVGVTMANVTITGGPASAYQGNAPAGSFHTANWTQNGKPLPNH